MDQTENLERNLSGGLLTVQDMRQVADTDRSPNKRRLEGEFFFWSPHFECEKD